MKANTLHNVLFPTVDQLLFWAAEQANQFQQMLKLRVQVAREREQLARLAEMPDYLLEDIGLSRTEALEESSQSDVPVRRMRKGF